MQDQPCHGPTVAEHALARAGQLAAQIEALQAERRALLRRAVQYRDSTMLHAEWMATRAELFQSGQLPNGDVREEQR